MTDIMEQLRAEISNREVAGEDFYDSDVTNMLRKAADEIERLREALERIDRWSTAYPLDVFPEPDFKKARTLLSGGGIALGAVSASNMRHVVDGVAKIARNALTKISERN